MAFVIFAASMIFWGVVIMKALHYRHILALHKKGVVPQAAPVPEPVAAGPKKRVVGPALLKGIKKAVTWTAPRLLAGIKVVGMTTVKATAKAVKKGRSATVNLMAAYRKLREEAAPKDAVSANVETDWSQYDTPPYMRQEQQVDRPTIH